MFQIKKLKKNKLELLKMIKFAHDILNESQSIIVPYG